MQSMKDQNTEKDLCSNIFQLSSGFMKVVEICTSDAPMYGKNISVALLQEYIRRIIAHHSIKHQQISCSKILECHDVISVRIYIVKDDVQVDI